MNARWLVASFALIGCTSDEGGEPPPLAQPPEFVGGFVEVPYTDPPPFVLYPPTPETDPSFGLFADLNGDGSVEVLIGPARSYDAEWKELRRGAVYRYDGAALVPHPTLSWPDGGSPIAAVDADGDGHVDLLSAPRGAVQVAWGLGGGAFQAPVEITGLLGGRIEGVHFDDFNDDGRLDIVAAAACCGDATCRDLHPLAQVAPRMYSDLSDRIIWHGSVGRPYVAASFSLLGRRVVCQLGWSCDLPESTPVFYEAAVDGSFRPVDLVPAGLGERSRFYFQGSLTAGSPMGASWGDLDGDGLLDLAVTLSPVYALFRGLPDGTLADVSDASHAAEIPNDEGYPMVPWGTAFLDFDRDGRDDLIVVHGHDDILGRPNDQSPQWVTAHWNAGGMRFVDVTDRVGLGRRGQWRALAVGDIDHDGDPDFIVGGQSEYPRVYLNEIQNNAGLSIRLRGTKSNHLGIGAWVDVMPGDGAAEQHYVVGGIASPHAVSDPAVFVGLGERAMAERVRVRWPSGQVQDVTGLSAGAEHSVQEP